MADKAARHFWAWTLVCSLALVVCVPWAAQAQEVRVGVLANKGVPRCLQEWTPTIAYLKKAIPDRDFSLTPLKFEEVKDTVSQGRVEFLLANSSIYVEMEAAHGVSRIATIKIPGASGAYSLFGGVVFCRAERDDIKTLADLKGKSFMAVDPQSFGGWRMAWREMKRAGMNPLSDFQSLRFGGYHDSVVMAVQRGEVDAGTVRTDTLERMESQGQIKLSEFRIINPQPTARTPFVRSTELYPEWPMAKVQHTPLDLAERVAVALLGMPPASPAAKAAAYAGWTIPESYREVHSCLRDLRLGPYADLGRFSLGEVVARYRYIILAFLLLLAGLAASTVLALRQTRRLRTANRGLESEIERRRRVEQERERLVAELQEALANVKTLRGMLPICANCKKIRNDEGYWEQVEGYLTKNSEARFTHGICPECAELLYPGYGGKK